MSRIAKKPISLPKGVELNVQDQKVSVKGPKGNLELVLHPTVGLKQEDADFMVEPKNEKAIAMAGTMRSLVANMVTGVSEGFEKKLALVGVGYRAQAQGNTLNLGLGFSHPINYAVPEGIKVETPSQTEVVVSGCDKQRVGQVAAEIRAFRPPEPYKGKGVRYLGEHVRRKAGKAGK